MHGIKNTGVEGMTKTEFIMLCTDVNVKIKSLLPICDAITDVVCEFYEEKGEYDSREEDQMLNCFTNLMMPDGKKITRMWFGDPNIENLAKRLECFREFVEQCYKKELYLLF